MSSFKMPYNQIENKIRSFKDDTDYTFTGEEYHPSDGNHKGCTTRNYKIISPQLQKVVRDYLIQQSAIFMQFEFEGKIHVDEWIRPDQAGKNWAEKYHAWAGDENGNGLNYSPHKRDTEASYSLSITYLDKPRTSAEKFNQAYQKAKKAWESKGSPLQNIPPKGTKCWSCYEVISDEDITAGRYRLENTRLGTLKGKLTFFKTFKHVKGVCKPSAYDCALRNNYRYHNELTKMWLEHPQKSHEYNCQDCLNRFWNEVNGNLIYLETWAKERMGEIDSTKRVLAEVEARLAKLKESGQFHNCGIKKCCVEHDRPDHYQSEKRDLIMTKKTAFNRQDLLDWMKEKGITKIYRWPQDSEQILIEYDNGRINNLSIANDFPSKWSKYLKQELSQSPLYLNQPANRNNQNRWPVGEITVGALIIIGLVSAFGILAYRLNKKK